MRHHRKKASTSSSNSAMTSGLTPYSWPISSFSAACSKTSQSASPKPTPPTPMRGRRCRLIARRIRAGCRPSGPRMICSISTVFIRIDFHSHYGSEYYCPVSLLRVYGLTHLRNGNGIFGNQRAARNTQSRIRRDSSLDRRFPRLYLLPLRQSMSLLIPAMTYIPSRNLSTRQCPPPVKPTHRNSPYLSPLHQPNPLLIFLLTMQNSPIHDSRKKPRKRPVTPHSPPTQSQRTITTTPICMTVGLTHM